MRVVDGLGQLGAGQPLPGLAAGQGAGRSHHGGGAPAAVGGAPGVGTGPADGGRHTVAKSSPSGPSAPGRPDPGRPDPGRPDPGPPEPDAVRNARSKPSLRIRMST